MKIKLQDNNIMSTDFIPNIKIAEFNNELTCRNKNYLVLWANFGQAFLELYERYRIDTDIVNMGEMINKMEALYQEYDYELLNVRRNNG